MAFITSAYNSNNESKSDLFTRMDNINTELNSLNASSEDFAWFGQSATAVKEAFAELCSNFNVFSTKVAEMFGENITMQNERMGESESTITSNVNNQDLSAG